jgi:hypothetical protein
MSTASTSHPGRLFAAAAILVTAPRLVLAFLVADGVAVPAGIRIALLGTSSVATAIAMTGGAAYLAHAITVTRRGRGILVAIWIAVLACSSALMTPLIAAGLTRSALAAVLPSSAQQWAWAVCAVLAIDLVAAGAIRADASQRRERDELVESHRREIVELLAQRDAAREALQALTVQERSPAAGAHARRPSAPLQRAPGAPERPVSAAPERSLSAAPERVESAAPQRLTSAAPDRSEGAAPEHPATTSAAPERPESAAPRSSPAPAERASAPPALTCSCGFTAPSQQALAGHLRWCSAGRSASAAAPAIPDEPAPRALT